MARSADVVGRRVSFSRRLLRTREGSRGSRKLDVPATLAKEPTAADGRRRRSPVRTSVTSPCAT